MDHDTAERLKRVVERRLKTRQDEDAENSAVHERRLARQHALAAIPGALQRLTRAVGEVNDVISDAAVQLKLAAAGETSSLEASFVVQVRPEGDPPAELYFNVNHEGRMTALLAMGEDRIALDARDVWAADRSFFEAALASLLEA